MEPYLTGACMVRGVLCLVLVLTAHRAAADDDTLVHLAPDGEVRVLRATVPDDLSGLFHPTSDSDQDKAEFSDPSNYRVPGWRGQGLRFRRDLQSLAEFPEWRLRGGEAQLCLGLRVKPAKYHIGVLASCKTDSAKDGFALFVWGNRLRFQFGDGTVSRTVEAKASLYSGGWHHVEARFDSGRVTLLVDGREIGQEQTPAARITPGRYGLFLGGYPAPGRGRKAYAYDGDMDEVFISLTPRTGAAERAPDAAATAPALEVLAEPISGPVAAATDGEGQDITADSPQRSVTFTVSPRGTRLVTVRPD